MKILKLTVYEVAELSRGFVQGKPSSQRFPPTKCVISNQGKSWGSLSK